MDLLHPLQDVFYRFYIRGELNIDDKLVGTEFLCRFNVGGDLVKTSREVGAVLGRRRREFDVSTNDKLKRFGIPARLLRHRLQLFKHCSDDGKREPHWKPPI